MCEICKVIESIKQGKNRYFVKELETGYVVVGTHQYFKGYSLFLSKQHKTELFHLEPSYKLKFLEEMSIVAEATYKSFPCDKMNYELLGNGDSHLHWHLFPRRTGDLGEYGHEGRGPVWWYPKEKMYDDATIPYDDEVKSMKKELLKNLNYILNFKK